jgi:hypothetical protein
MTNTFPDVVQLCCPDIVGTSRKCSIVLHPSLGHPSLRITSPIYWLVVWGLRKFSDIRYTIVYMVIFHAHAHAQPPNCQLAVTMMPSGDLASNHHDDGTDCDARLRTTAMPPLLTVDGSAGTFNSGEFGYFYFYYLILITAVCQQQ